MRVVFLRSVVLAAVVATVVGCGGDVMKRQPVSGVVKYNGADIKYGSIRFEPAEGQKTAGSGSIRDGKYEIERSAGLSPGKYKVWVQAFDRSGEVPPGTAPGQEGPPPKDILPKKYQDGPAGEASIKEVTDGQPNDVSLNLPK